MDRQEVFELVATYADQFGPTNRPERKDIEKQLKSVEHSELFEGLFSLFLLENSPYSYIRQQNAGVILYKLKPKVHFDLKQRIKMCLATWDLSVEELPYYMAEKCGSSRVLQVIDELRSEELSEREKVALDTFVYWLDKL